MEQKVNRSRTSWGRKNQEASENSRQYEDGTRGNWEEELTYLASRGREGTLLEEVEGLASSKHDDVCWGGRMNGDGEEEREEWKRRVEVVRKD